MLHHADEEAADDVDEKDQDAGGGVATHELGCTVHRTVEVRFLAHFLAPLACLFLGEQAGVEVGVDRHLLAWHRIQGEPRGDFRHAGGTLGDHHEIDHHDDRKHHQTHREVAANDELAERLDDLAGGARAVVSMQQHDAGGGDVQRQSQQGGHQHHGGERGEFQRSHHVDHGQQDHQRQRDVEAEQDIQQERRHRQHQHAEHRQHDHRRANAPSRQVFEIA